MMISIVMPVFNAEQYLEEAIESLLNQSVVAGEIIIVDDGSTDGSKSIARSYSQVKYYYIENSGPAAARNFGIERSLGEAVAFHDADDICKPDRLAKQLEALEQNSVAEFCVCYLQNFIEPGCQVPKERQTDVLLAPRQGFVSAGLFRKTIFTTVGVFDERYRNGEDIEWFYRASKMGVKPVVIPDVLVRRRLHSKNVSHEYKLGHESLFRMIREQNKFERN